MTVKRGLLDPTRRVRTLIAISRLRILLILTSSVTAVSTRPVTISPTSPSRKSASTPVTTNCARGLCGKNPKNRTEMDASSSHMLSSLSRCSLRLTWAGSLNAKSSPPCDRVQKAPLSATIFRNRWIAPKARLSVSMIASDNSSSDPTDALNISLILLDRDADRRRRIQERHLRRSFFYFETERSIRHSGYR